MKIPTSIGLLVHKFARIRQVIVALFQVHGFYAYTKPNISEYNQKKGLNMPYSRFLDESRRI
jgi:hypothetical protein